MSRTRIDPSLLNNLSSNLNMGSNKIVSLANGTASTDAAAFGQIPTVSSTWTTFTPSVTGGGSISQTSGWYMRVGKMLFVQAAWKNGTVAATTASMAIPGGFSIDTSFFTTGAIPHLGLAISPHTGNNVASSIMAAIFCDGSDTANVYFDVATASGSAFTKQNGNAIWVTSDYTGVNFNVPIQ